MLSTDVMEGIYVHSRLSIKQDNRCAVYNGIIVFPLRQHFRVATFTKLTWSQMIRLAEEKYGLKLHPKVYFCSE